MLEKMQYLVIIADAQVAIAVIGVEPAVKYSFV